MNDGSLLAILLHSSKTMKVPPMDRSLREPVFADRAHVLMSKLALLNESDISISMKISDKLANEAINQISNWRDNTSGHGAAIDSFVGDIYSGLRSSDMTDEDLSYADRVLFILSGLYGVLRPLDKVRPYRLEMGYRFSKVGVKNMYDFWQDSIVDELPETGYLVNLSAVEYTKAVLPYVDASRVVTPVFLTVNRKTGKPGFVAVHSKIARGAFARWLILNRINDIDRLSEFDDLGYKYNASESTRLQPVFVCEIFEGKGLSVRLK